MSLLLDARKKSQAQTTQQSGDAPAAHPETARDAGQNMFSAKSPPPLDLSMRRKLLLGLGALVVLAGIGAAYLWLGTDTHTMLPVPALQVPTASVPPAPVARIDEPAVTDEEPASPPAPLPERKGPPPAAQTPESIPAGPVRIEQPRKEEVEPLLRDAYQAYGDGNLDEAQRLYQEMYRKDTRNPDALLGLAAIAQQRGDAELAARYYAGVLALDPRNAAANAGMSALSPDDSNNESRLKLLLREQGDSAVLHFALGNLYAEQSRWSEAQQAYFDAWTLEPGNAGFAYSLAVSLDHLGQSRLAAQHYRRALQLDPANSAGFDHEQVSRRIADLER